MSVRFQITGDNSSPDDLEKQRVGFRGVSDIEEEQEVAAEDTIDEEEELSPRTATSQSLASDVEYYMDNESGVMLFYTVGNIIELKYIIIRLL